MFLRNSWQSVLSSAGWYFCLSHQGSLIRLRQLGVSLWHLCLWWLGCLDLSLYSLLSSRRLVWVYLHGHLKVTKCRRIGQTAMSKCFPSISCILLANILFVKTRKRAKLRFKGWRHRLHLLIWQAAKPQHKRHAYGDWLGEFLAIFAPYRDKLGSSLVAYLIKNLPAMQETRVWFLGW